MVWIVLSSLLLIIGLGAGVVFANAETSSGKVGSKGFAAAFGVAAILWLAVSFFFSVHIVDTRNVGVVKTLGSITGQVGEGVQLTWPWQTVEEWNIRVQVIEPDTRCSNGTLACMDAGSIDIQDVYINGALNIEVDTKDVQELARNVGQGYRDTIVRNRLYQVVKRVTANYRADEILARREEIRALVREGMTTELAPYSIRVTDFLLTNIDFTDQFRVSIDAKQKATQDALTAENVVRIKEAEARQKAAEAFGNAERLRIEAQGQADANLLISQSLTPQLIQFQAVQKLSDKIQIALIPSGQGIIIDPASLLRTGQ